jgi:predicted GIY-YIG superfamily endonuclease
MGTVYLIHFEEPLAHAQHYLGFTDDLLTRLEQHRKGNGSRLMQVVGERGIDWILARTWQGSRKLERKLKNRKNSPRLCTICQALRAEATHEAENDQKHC